MNDRKTFARRELAGASPPPEGWTLTTLAERGERDFIQLMVLAGDGDPHHASTAETAQEDFRKLVAAAGAAFDATAWFAVADRRGQIGVVLPQILPDDPATGTLLYIAVVPGRRGQGLGRRLHRFGLGRLALCGARRYVGSTDPANQPMIAIFRANGCRLEQA